MQSNGFTAFQLTYCTSLDCQQLLQRSWFGKPVTLKYIHLSSSFRLTHILDH